jgi:prepilin-type N-terminal cleavage/methylation domain-containing protein
MRKAFTLIEMLISISILSIMMVFLYQSYAALNGSNNLLHKELNKIKDKELKKKVIFLDFSTIVNNKVDILNQDVK